MIKRLAKAAIWRAQRWVEETTRAEPAPEDYGRPPLSYDRANRFFNKLIAENHLERPQYVWGALQGVNLAKAIGIQRVSIIEFGVAGGNGLVALERIAGILEAEFEIAIDVHGFDGGVGLPKPRDHRDLPNLWRENSYPMDREKLQQRLKKAKLHIGMVEETVPAFINSRPAPVGFISFDLDHYTATTQALKLLQADFRMLLPRIPCYFDDIMAVTFSDFTGERLAIAEFNSGSADRKVSMIHGLRYFLPAPHNRSMWTDMMFLAHIFDHELYGVNDGLVSQSGHDLRDDGLET